VLTLMGDGWAAMKAEILKILEMETWISGLERFLKYSKYSIYILYILCYVILHLDLLQHIPP